MAEGDAIPDYAVVVLTGQCAGAEVTSDGVPWRGDLRSARSLRDEMAAQARRFGHLDVTYATYGVERLTPCEPCACGHMWSEHDNGGCHYQDGCTKDGTDG